MFCYSCKVPSDPGAERTQGISEINRVLLGISSSHCILSIHRRADTAMLIEHLQAEHENVLKLKTYSAWSPKGQFLLLIGN